MYKFTIKVPIYGFSCQITIAEDIEKYINKQLKKLEDYEELKDDSVHGFAMQSGRASKYFLFFKTSSVNINTVAHEISHLIDYVFDDRGIEKIYGDEPRAYLTGHVSEKIFDYLLKNKLLINEWLKN